MLLCFLFCFCSRAFVSVFPFILLRDHLMDLTIPLYSCAQINIGKYCILLCNSVCDGVCVFVCSTMLFAQFSHFCWLARNLYLSLCGFSIHFTSHHPHSRPFSVCSNIFDRCCRLCYWCCYCCPFAVCKVLREKSLPVKSILCGLYYAYLFIVCCIHFSCEKKKVSRLFAQSLIRSHSTESDTTL